VNSNSNTANKEKKEKKKLKSYNLSNLHQVIVETEDSDDLFYNYAIEGKHNRHHSSSPP
jgi:hypothetical protein